MKLLLDECVTQKLRHHIVAHKVFTVGYMGWDGTRNGRLLARAAAADGFDAMVTTDRGIEHEQNLDELPVSVYLLEGASDELPDLLPLVPPLLAMLANAPAQPAFFRVKL